MRLLLDKWGRVLLPKPLRDRIGLRARTTFEATETVEGVLLRPITRSSLVVRCGLLVHAGEAPRAFGWQQLSDDLEREMLNQVLKIKR